MEKMRWKRYDGAPLEDIFSFAAVMQLGGVVNQLNFWHLGRFQNSIS